MIQTTNWNMIFFLDLYEIMTHLINYWAESFSFLTPLPSKYNGKMQNIWESATQIAVQLL